MQCQARVLPLRCQQSMTKNRAPGETGANDHEASGTGDDRHFVTALARGLEVLACFPSGEAQLGNQQLAERCKLPKSTVSRLTMTLTRLGYLIQVPDTGRYRLGMATLALGTAMMSGLDVRRVARPLMQELSAFSGASVSLGVRDRLSVIYIEHCRAQAALAVSSNVGSRYPIAISAMGRAYLAVAEDAERRGIMLALKAQNASGWPDMLAGIEKAAQDHLELGVTCSFGDWQSDINGIGRAFNPGGGLPPMAISCTGPASRLTQEFLLEAVRPRLIEMTQRIEASLPR
ncbi:MAG: IclR family transcriptional regulator [Burkholderiaceae bacterium]|nr:IclR family transcriptional regulator [Burkholderiaceae bacterium]